MDASEVIRKHLKTLTAKDIADSTYLFGIDFDNDSIENIFGALNSLYEEVISLHKMINRNFTPEDDIKVMLPKDPASQTLVIQNYYAKENALLKALNNDIIYKNFITYRNTKKEKEPTK